ncbi:hypothetical protein [Hymenobacter sp. BT559]|uniref:hypothetical protein n=1 Tax=Hymenobacter sp. BT559 TaxID=2795729 RepID=UPI0018EDE464|nr:hypothetical protein [Hymenobacter sp. BT559]MBJ6142111.1 hypothetical protein [Hymenobacter sp. BT559]
MIKIYTYTLLFLLLLAGCPAAQAQTATAPISPLSTVPDSIPRTFGRWYLPHYQESATVADTAGALVALFARKRANTWWYLPIFGLGIALIQPGEKTTNGVRTGSSPPDSWQYAAGIPLMIGGVAPIIGRLSTYSRSRLRTIQQDYEAGKSIPASLRRKLKPRYFASAAIIRVAIVQQLQMEKLRAQQKALRKR